MRPDLQRCVQLACLWEVTARKPGNVHRFQDFGDLNYLDFVASAVAIGDTFTNIALARSVAVPPSSLVGDAVLMGVRATREVARTNTNLGILLLLVPLADAAARGRVLRDDVENVLRRLTVQDAIKVYEAIRLAAPSGLGKVEEQDVSEAPTQTLREVMRLAADRDLVARQYANGFREVFDDGVPALERGLQDTASLEGAIIFCYLRLLSLHPDSLIARKCGARVAQEASARAARVLDAGWPHTAAGRDAIADFDAWLRADGHRRNPGTTADLVAACLFVALRQGIITLPPGWPWSLPAPPQGQ
jgi:triphosphoribosyl-dephospho-CoA synthase